MKIIDAHIHLSNLEVYVKMLQNLNASTNLKEIEVLMYKNNIVFSIGMGISDFSYANTSFSSPMLLDLDRKWNPFNEQYSKRIACCPGINPYMLLKYKKKYLDQLEKLLALKHIVGIKLYLGYYPFYVHDDVYDSIFQLAEKYDLPVVAHTGDLSTSIGQLKYAHPLSIDEAAVKYPRVKFVMAHFGNPWIIDASSVALKNNNVYADLSGLVVGNFDLNNLLSTQSGYISYLKSALDYLYSYDKLLFATDWPFAPISNYIEFIQEMVPTRYHNSVFFENSINVFNRLHALI